MEKIRKFVLFLAVVLMCVSFISVPSGPDVQAAKENEEIVYNFAVDVMKVNDAVVCGILANIYSESNFNPNVEYIEADGSVSYGICQWNKSRLENLKSFCQNNGYDYTSLMGQLYFMKYELEGAERSAYNKIKNASDDAEGAYLAGYNWARYYERCSSRSWEKRGALSRDTYWPVYGNRNETADPYETKNPDDFIVPINDIYYNPENVMKGLDVGWVQAVLYQLGYEIDVDGSFGPASETAVKKFQQDAELTVNGRADSATRQKLSGMWELKSRHDIDLNVWISETGWGSSVSAVKTGNKYYFCYEIVDKNTGKRIDTLFDKNYTVTVTGYNLDGSISEKNMYKNDSSCLEFVRKQAGDYSVSIEVSGDIIFNKDMSYTVEREAYTVAYNANGGSGAPAAQIKYSDEPLVISSVKPVRDSYEFLGWAADSSSDKVKYNPGDKYTENSGATLYAVWRYVDKVKPTGTISSTNDVSSSQRVTLTFTDNVGVDGYYWGVNSDYNKNGYTKISKTSAVKTISSEGVYYLTVRDTSGNISQTCSITFYKTFLNANGGSVTPEYIITKSGNSFVFPVPERKDYSYDGWAVSSDSAGGSKSITPDKNSTYYAVWKPAEQLSVKYCTHVQTYGWEGNWKQDGDISGTVGEAKRLEGMKIELQNQPVSGNIQYRSHIQTYGWEKNWKQDGGISGTVGEAKRLEAVQIKLTGQMAEKYDIYYRVHAQTYGWLGWAKNGEPAGTEGYAKRLEAIEIVLVEKGKTAPGSMENAFITSKIASVTYHTHVQTYGWGPWIANGAMSGTTGEAKRMEGIEIRLDDMVMNGDINYRTHVQTYGWGAWAANGAMSGTTGEAKRLEAIQITLGNEIAEKYDIYYRVHAQTYGWLGWAKNGEPAGTAGLAKRLEAIEIVLVKKGEKAPGITGNSFVN